jgi:SAM-dependent methyltransferase
MDDHGAKDPWLDPWRGEAVGRWLALEESLEPKLAPFGDAALARAGARPGERVLDVGCGCGPTTITLGAAVGPTGQVLGVDIAGALLARARGRAAALPQVTFLEADAQSVLLARDRDLVFSRFGVMFFQDTGAAFRNLVTALRPGGRMAFACWRSSELNPWLDVPFAATREVLPDAAAPLSDGPGPFRLADPERLRALLVGAGLTGVEIEAVDHPVRLGADLASAVEFAMSTGPTGRALPGRDRETLARVRERIATRLAPRLSSEGVVLKGSAWTVTASFDG